jgi:S-adenosylmethionine/arginine decarboxylase-like enzyme
MKHWLRCEDYKNVDFDKLLKEAGFQVLGFNEYHFQPQGYSAVWLLGESHLAVHTFPEEGLVYVELSSCIEDKFRKFLELYPYRMYLHTMEF